MKKLNEIPNKNDSVNIIDKNKTLVTKIPENGIESRRPQVSGMIVTRI
jgi:hypothetical protein